MARRPDPARRIAALRERLNEAAYLYYNVGEPPMSDAEYDRLYRELQELEHEHPELVTPDSPTQRVGASLPKGTSFAKLPHLAPMLSLESLNSEAEVREFADRARKYLELDAGETIRWAVEPKFDGVSASLLYEDGALVRGLTRGDGTVGEDVTHNLRTIRNLPLGLRDADGPLPKRVEVRGEVILARSTFEQLRETMETSADTPFRNARNTAAGTLKLLDPAIVAKRGLEFIAWGVGHLEGRTFPTYATLVAALRGFGFTTSRWFEVVDDIDGVLDFHHRLEAERDAIDYELDGVVAKVDDIELQRRLGRTARAPRWSLAYKFAPRRATTRVVAIRAQVGRTGAVTPVAELEPTDLAGVTVRRATLHNWGLVAERDVRVGDVVDIERAGDVIPAVVHVHRDRRGRESQPTEAPSNCPVCGSALETEGAFAYCVDVECPATLRGRVVHLASRRALAIEGLGPKNVDQLMEAGLIRTLEDVFRLPERREAILALPRWGERSFEKLANEIAQASHPPLDKLLYALGIRHVGEQTARAIAADFDTLEAVQEAGEERLCEIEGVGPEVARSIRAFFDLEGNRRFLAEARRLGLRVRAAPALEGGPLAGRVFCFTGGLNAMSRDEARALVERLGARTSASVTERVTDVVAGAKAGTKLEKARKLGLRVLSEEEFVDLVGDTSR